MRFKFIRGFMLAESNNMHEMPPQHLEVETHNVLTSHGLEKMSPYQFGKDLIQGHYNTFHFQHDHENDWSEFDQARQKVGEIHRDLHTLGWHKHDARSVVAGDDYETEMHTHFYHHPNGSSFSLHYHVMPSEAVIQTHGEYHHE
jgi:hypothetical protein